MGGIYSGVQQRIKELEPRALHVHCANHNLNLVVNDAVNSVREINNYFSLLQSVYVFFGNSINRWDLLTSCSNESQITLKKLYPTRWAGRLASLTAVKERFFDMLKVLQKIILESNKKDEKSEAIRIKKCMEKFEFLVMTIMLSHILSSINLSSTLLQRKYMDIALATEKLDIAYNTI